MGCRNDLHRNGNGSVNARALGSNGECGPGLNPKVLDNSDLNPHLTGWAVSHFKLEAGQLLPSRHRSNCRRFHRLGYRLQGLQPGN